MGGGVLFLVALALCTWYLARNGALEFNDRWRLAVSGLIVFCAYPLSVFGLALTGPFTLRHQNLERISDQYFLCLLAIGASFEIWAALCVVLEHCPGRPLAQLLISGITWAALFTWIASTDRGSRFGVFAGFSVFFAIGQALFAAICGYAIARQQQTLRNS
ncbi:MAG TPA: hypothetical protein VKB26_12325 [Candidatus Acidoferrales bacterium]|nr:hypothetical protein [Candidatus Acidoferrales bacterium]